MVWVTFCIIITERLKNRIYTRFYKRETFGLVEDPPTGEMENRFCFCNVLWDCSEFSSHISCVQGKFQNCGNFYGSNISYLWHFGFTWHIICKSFLPMVTVGFTLLWCIQMWGFCFVLFPPLGKDRKIRFTELEVLVPTYLRRVGFAIPILWVEKLSLREVKVTMKLNSF